MTNDRTSDETFDEDRCKAISRRFHDANGKIHDERDVRMDVDDAHAVHLLLADRSMLEAENAQLRRDLDDLRLKWMVSAKDGKIAADQIEGLRRDLERLREALEKLWKHTPKIDGFRCMVCRRGSVHWEGHEPHVSECSDPDCLSHVVKAALAASAPPAVEPSPPTPKGAARDEQREAEAPDLLSVPQADHRQGVLAGRRPAL
jgi:hypothetical protein